MDRYSEEVTNRELEDYKDSYYNDMKNGCIKVKSLDKAYRCPFCHGGRKDYPFDLLLNHASGIGRSKRWELKERAKHLALEKYLRRYLDKTDKGETSAKHVPPLPDDTGEKFVYPWVGIVANIQTELKDGRHVGESGSKLRDELRMKGFEPQRVHPLWNRLGHSSFAIVEFKKTWDGFKNAMMFEKDYEAQGCGMKEYWRNPHVRGDRLFGWVARADDYNSRGLIGEHLRKMGDLKSVSAKEAEDQRMNSTLVSNLNNTLQMKNDKLKDMQSKYDETNASLNKLMIQKDEMINKYNDEMSKMQQQAHDYFEMLSVEHEKARQQLEARRKELEQEEEQLQQREELNENERKRIHDEKKMNARATLEQKKSEESMLKLAMEQKKEKELLHEKIIKLEKKLDAKQALQLEIERLKGSLKVMKHMADGDAEVKDKMKKIQEELDEKKDEFEYLESINQALIVKERRTNDELQEARKELIKGLGDATSRARLGVKKMGELDEKAFYSAAKEKFPDKDSDVWAAEKCSLWEDYLRDPSWHPFKIIEDKEGHCKEFIDEQDEKLKALKEECGDGVYNAVTTALMEMNQYNPSGRYIVRELWNFEEGKKAQLKDVVKHILMQWRRLKRKRT